MLTDEEIQSVYSEFLDIKGSAMEFARRIERAVLAKAMPVPKQEPDIEKIGDLLSNAEIAIQSLLEQKPAYRMGYQYDEGNEDPDLGGDLVLHQLDGKDYPVGALFYASPVPSQAAAIPENKTPSVEQQLEFVTAERDGIRKHRDQLLERLNSAPHWVAIDDPADMPDDTEHVLWDGCDLSVDFTDTEVDYGTTFFSNGTEATHYLANLQPPISASPKPDKS